MPGFVALCDVQAENGTGLSTYNTVQYGNVTDTTIMINKS